MVRKGKVFKLMGKWYQVMLDDGKVIDCCICGKLWLDGLKMINLLVVGDVVFVQDQFDDEGMGVIEDFELCINYIV